MIRVRDLTKRYGSHVAVDRLTFEIGPGEIVGFLGPNGAGKTTTIRVLTGFHPASGGTAHVAGHDVATDSLEVRRRLGYLPQEVPIYPDLRVAEYLRYRAALKGVPPKARAQAVARAMDKAGIADVARKLVGHVSHGYRQRVGLADALVANPPVLIFDEPTSGLDPNQRRRRRGRRQRWSCCSYECEEYRLRRRWHRFPRRWRGLRRRWQELQRRWHGLRLGWQGLRRR
jgi:ABC-2 type transport system ATP-binding protein